MGNKQGLLYKSLKKSDPELQDILRKEKLRQKNTINLIASENYTSVAALQANGSIFSSKYAEGYPGRRYYNGCEHIDELELLCQKRALEAFDLDPKVWGVNVQGLSGSPANFAVYAGLLKPGERIMGMALPSGGHLTHGAITPSGKKLSNSSIFFESKSYAVDLDTYLIDYETLHEEAMDFNPDLLIVGGSAYSQDYDYTRFRKIADDTNCYLMADIAHTSGLIASKLLRSPFETCDVVTTTTHKTLRGPRGALIFYRLPLKEQIDFSVFPGSQGGAHYNTVAGICTALKQVNTPKFRRYSSQVIANASYLSSVLQSYGFTVITGDTDNHLLLIDLTKNGSSGAKFELIAERCGISLNKNTIATDRSAFSPSGIRIGTPAMTSRGFVCKDFHFVADCLKEILAITLLIQGKADTTKMSDFHKAIDSYADDIEKLHTKVVEYCSRFNLPDN